MTSNEIVTTLEEGVRIIRINRPKTRNAFDLNVYVTITKTLHEDANNDAVIVTIITGTGEYYSSGFDIKSSMAAAGDGSDAMITEFKNMLYALITYPKLLIALINGHAIGMAVTTAALCDIVYASEKATFVTPFAKMGLCAEGCSSYTFPNIMGKSKASEMLILGKKITAQEAYQFGFISEVIPHEKFDEFTNELKQLGKKLSVNSVKINKKLILDNYRSILCECAEKEINQLTECFLSEEFSDGVTRFMTRKSKL